MATTYKKIKSIIFDIFYDDEGKHWYHKIDDYFISTLIILNVVAIVLESFKSIRTDFGSILSNFELFSVIIFSIEYILRLWVADLNHKHLPSFKARLKYIFSFYGLVDLLAVLPFYLPFFLKLDFRALRILRLLRTLRLFKLGNYSKSLRTIGDVIKEKRSDLIITISITGIILLIAATFMYEIENTVQPEAFPNVFATLWWAVATLTTIGYGDVYPITALGKGLAAITALLGIGIVAIPTGIISSGFIDKMEERKKKKISPTNETNTSYYCPHCGKKFNIDE
jgi:voltage-gated potassium channel